MSGPEITEFSDEIRYRWGDRHIALQFTRLHETDSGRVVGFMSVVNPDHHNGSGPERLYWQAVTLTTASDRKLLTAKLQGLAPQGASVWEADVDRCFQDAYERHTAVPEPVILTGADETDLDTEYLVEPVLPVGQVTLLLADQGTTKSYLMEYLSACITLGHRTVFSEPLCQGPVIYFDWEVDEQTANRRLGWICRGLEVSPPRDLHYVNMSTRGRIFDRIRDMRHMVERIHPVLVVIDSLTFATGADLNSAEYAAPTMTAVGSLGEGVTKLVSAHPNKASRNANSDDISVIGSSLFEYRARAIWHMKREQGVRTARFGVSMTPRKQFDGPPQRSLAYTMDFDNVNHAACFRSARLSDLPNLEKSTLPVSAQIRRALARGGRLDTNQLADVLAQKPEVIKMECNRMADVFPVVLGGGRGKPTVWALRADEPKPDQPYQ